MTEEIKNSWDHICGQNRCSVCDHRELMARTE